MTESDDPAAVAQALGVEFLAYVLSLDQAAIEARLVGALPRLDAPHEQALHDVIRHATELVNIPNAHPEGTLEDRVRRLGWVDMDREQSHANLFRIATGGMLPAVPERLDAAERVIAGIATDYFPVTLLPEVPERFVPAKPLIARARLDALHAAMEEIGDPLLRLFDDDVIYYTSTGFGYGPLRAFRAAEDALATADQWVKVRGDASPATYIESVVTNFRIMRSLCRDGSAEVPVMVGISNIEIPDGVTLQGPRGATFRAATERDPHVPMTERATMVLESTATVGFAIGDVPPLASPFFAGAYQLAAEERLISLAGLLATLDADQRTMPRVVWTKTFDPFQPYAGVFASEQPVPMMTFPAAKLREFEAWILRLDAHFDPVIGVAVRRCVKAFGDRPESDDALIDLVIALENLFATRGPKLKQRIAAGIVALLSESPEDQLDLKERAEMIYDARSDLVHGDDLPEMEPHPREVAEELLLRTFEVLFTTRTELIADPRARARLSRP